MIFVKAKTPKNKNEEEMKKAICLAALLGCNGITGMQSKNMIAVTISSGGELILDRYCADQMRAIGHSGHRDGGACLRDDGPRAATEDQMRELSSVRSRYAPVFAAYSLVAVEYNKMLDNRSAISSVVKKYVFFRSIAKSIGINMTEIKQ